MPRVTTWRSVRPARPSSDSCQPLKPNIAWYMRAATSRFSERNSTQPRITTRKATAHFSGLKRRGAASTPRARSIASQRPCQAPQSTKVKLAPCHRPPSNMVSIRLR
ncbi:hypothetical protein D9M68_731670 [compost metagenome]